MFVVSICRVAILILSAVELWEQQQLKPDEKALEYAPCMKHEDIDGSFLQSKQLQFTHIRFGEKISGEKIDKLGSLSIGEYEPAISKVTVVKVKGKLWSHYGYNDGERMLLHPEEAYFLMDVGTLRVYYNSLALSLQEACGYFFDKKEVSLDHYLVYSYLSRLGYIVRRLADPYAERHPLNQKSKRKKTVSADDCNEHQTESLILREISREPVSKLVKPSEVSDREQIAEEDVPLMEPLRGDVKEIQKGQKGITEQVKMLDEEQDKHIKHTHFDYADIEFPTFGGMRVKSQPGKISISGHPHETPSSTATANLTNHFDSFSVMGYRDTKQFSTAKCWTEFKDDHRKRLSLLESDSWLDPHSSLVGHPCQVDDFSDLLDMLQLSQTTSLKSLNRNRKFHQDSLVFDVYQPNPNFKKSDPGNPHHRIIVLRPDDAVPNLSDIALLHSIGDDVPFYWAICDGGDISFYCQTQESAKSDLYKPRKPRKKNQNYASIV